MAIRIDPEGMRLDFVDDPLGKSCSAGMARTQSESGTNHLYGTVLALYQLPHGNLLVISDTEVLMQLKCDGQRGLILLQVNHGHKLRVIGR